MRLAWRWKFCWKSHTKEKDTQKSARCQDRTDDLRIMGPTRSRLRQPRLDIIVSLRNTWGANFYRFVWQKNFFEPKNFMGFCENNDSCRTSRSSIGRALDCRILGYRAVAGSIPAERIFFRFRVPDYFLQTDDCLKTKNGENYSSRIQVVTEVD